MSRRFLIFIVTALICALTATCCAAAPTVALTDARTEIGDSCVAYPQLEGMEDKDIQSKINDDIITSADITSHIVTLATLGNSAWGLNVDYEAYLGGDVLSVVISAKGKQPDGRNGHEYTALNYDLRTGERLAAGDIFADVNEAAARIGEIIEASLSEELTGYLENRDLSPLPMESFTVDADGITFWYPYEQFAYLSEYSGSCQLGYGELQGLLNEAPDGIPARLGALPAKLTPEEARAAIKKAAEDGALPHVPVRLGESMSDVIERYRLLRTPDDYPGGRYYKLEAPKMRDIYVISDSLRGAGEWEHSVVEGLRAERGELYGLVIGKSAREEWISALGEPDEVIELNESMAYDYNLPVGSSDVYKIGGRTLSFHADSDGVLRSVRLQN